MNLDQLTCRLALGSFPIRSLVRSKRSLRLVYYHRVSGTTDPYYFNTGITPAIFERQLDYLQANYQIIPLSQAYQRARNGDDLAGYVCITFDDGFAECYGQIFPTLRRRKIKATFFILEDCLNNTNLMWRNKLRYIEQTTDPVQMEEAVNAYCEAFEDFDQNIGLLKHSNTWSMSDKEKRADFLWTVSGMEELQSFLSRWKPYLTDENVFNMLEDGQEIGCHTKSHPFCDTLDDQETIREIVEPTSRLSDRFGIDINALAYPFGRRPSEEKQDFVRINSGLEILLGIQDTLRNDATNTSQWERVGMEKSYERSLLAFYAKPLIRSLNRQYHTTDTHSGRRSPFKLLSKKHSSIPTSRRLH